MKITISKKELMGVLSDVEKCVSKTEIIPVTGSVLINASKSGEVSFVTTDNEKGMRIVSQCNVVEDGTCAIPFKKLIGIVKELSHTHDITISSKENKVKITSGSSKFNIVTHNCSEFPVIDFDCNNGKSIQVKESDIKKINQYISISVSNDPSFAVINGIGISAKHGIVIASSTDRRRMSQFKFDYSGDQDGFGSTIVVPSETISSISNIIQYSDNMVTVSTDNNRIFFKIGNKTMCSRLIQGNFPDLSGRIPNNGHAIIFKHSDLSGAVKQITPFVTKDVFRIIIGTDGDKALISIRDVGGDAEVEIGVKQEGGDKFVCGVNCEFISSFLRAINGDNAIIRVSNDKGGLVCGSDNESGYSTVIMPMTID